MYVPLEEREPFEPVWMTRPESTHILICQPVTDNEAEAALAQLGYRVFSAPTGPDALDVLSTERIHLVFLDLMAPDTGGFMLLNRIRAAYPLIPVVACSSPCDPALAARSMREGAADYVPLPLRTDEFAVVAERNLVRASLTRRNDVEHKMNLQRAYRSLIETLLVAIETRDTETEGHSERVAAFTVVIAQRMGLQLPELIPIERGALLHDIGKIGVPDSILLKKGELNEEEWAIMRQHPLIGYQICSRVDLMQEAAAIVLHHHERFDGDGYPSGLKGDQIPLGARIFAVVDSFDAMTSDRPYRAAISDAEAVEEIKRCSGTQFDPEIVEKFASIPIETWRQIRSLIKAGSSYKAA